MEKIIIFGGSFNPIHKQHINIALKALKKIKANRVIFVPNVNHPNKKIDDFEKQYIYKMAEIATKDYYQFEVSDYEINQNEISYTIDTINFFKSKFPNIEIYFLLGDDQLLNFHTWKNYQEILDKTKIISFKRNSIRPKVNFSYIKIGFFSKSISSSRLRLNPNKKHLNPQVLNFINKKGMYAIERLQNNVSQYRIEHSIRVKDIALEICKSLEINELIDRTYVAAIYHDYCKEMSEQDLIKVAKKLKIFNYPSYKVLHGPVGSYIIKKKFFIDDYSVSTAIANHVIPIDESTLTKIIYCADKLDIRKDWIIPNRDELLNLAKINLNEAFLKIKNIINNIENKKIC